MRQIIVDTETTGLSVAEGHRIIEIGCLELINRKLTGKRFHSYINPQRAIDKEAESVHGLNSDFLQTKPLFSDIATELMTFLTGAELIIHNAAFDVGFLNYELTLLNQGFPSITEACRILDTLALARQLHTGQRNSLDALCKRYSVDNSERNLHGALIDCHLLAQVYLSMTGGQGSLFEGNQPGGAPVTDKNRIESSSSPSKKRQLSLCKATFEEVALHEALLKMMTEKGKCLWGTLSKDSQV